MLADGGTLRLAHYMIWPPRQQYPNQRFPNDGPTEHYSRASVFPTLSQPFSNDAPLALSNSAKFPNKSRRFTGILIIMTMKFKSIWFPLDMKLNYRRIFTFNSIKIKMKLKKSMLLDKTRLKVNSGKYKKLLCRTCGKVIITCSNTTNLKSHVNQMHSDMTRDDVKLTICLTFIFI